MALLKTIADLKYYVPINSSFEFSEILPMIRQVETEFIVPRIGMDTYIDLDVAYNAVPETMNAEQEALLPFLQKAISWLSVMRWIPMGNLQATAGGFQVVTSDNMSPASQWRVNDFELECRRNGYNALEEMLEFLWLNTDDYPDYETSDEYEAHRNLMLLTSKEFQKHVDIGNSYEIFEKLKPYTLLVMENHIKPITGDELYDDIMEDILINSISTNNEVLMKFIRTCIANLALANGAARLAVDLQAYGIIVHSKGDRDNVNVEGIAPDNLLSSLVGTCKRNGLLYENKLRVYLKENASDYPLYESSDAYEDPEDDDEDGDNINDQDSGFFMFR